MNKKRFISMFAVFVSVLGLISVAPVFATTNGGNGWQGGGQPHNGVSNYGQARKMTPSVFGTVSAISGDTITVSGRSGGFGGMGRLGTTTPQKNPTSAVTYTVDATNATVMKNNATSTVSNIAVGDTIIVQGTINGTDVTATMIRDGVMRGPGMANNGSKNGQDQGNALGQIQGNGQPVVAGAVSAVSGSALTITNKSNVQYSVDATNAKIVKGNNASSTISDVAVGDNIIVQGAVNGNSITASTVIDQNKPVAQNPSNSSGQGRVKVFFGSVARKIGGFFSHMFGF